MIASVLMNEPPVITECDVGCMLIWMNFRFGICRFI